ncbi:unnamed protein product [Ectocarpus sp. CCAP 1310/34]|nr:unnamed protein product [Ectocarpus sp. CCAP 1310/34]
MVAPLNRGINYQLLPSARRNGQVGVAGAVVHIDHDANVHYVRNLPPDFHVQRSVLLTHSEVKTKLVEKVILTAWAKTEAARKRASESVGAYALVTGGDNRGGGGGNMGDRGKAIGQMRTAAR